jgi:LmbE family N-acetylglucosaminyl deacetylase
MLRLSLPDRPLRIVCLGAHPDDVEIGAGGAILAWAAGGHLGEAWWLVMTGTTERAAEARDAAARFADPARPVVRVEGLPDGHLPAHWGEAKDRLEAFAREVDPDIVLTHRLDDAHQDHRVVAELTTTVFRDHLVLRYEVPKWDGDVGRPNVYLPLPAATMERKVALLEACFASQRGRDWFAGDTFRAVGRLRGVECRAPEGFAEAFEASKLTL